MRIIGGRFKGRALRGPSGAGVRPTSDRLRETLFNIVSVDAPGCRVLDGFAGTGALGLEALSRGARRVTFVDRDPHAIALIRDNVARCGVADACIISRGDFLGAAGRRDVEGPFDLVLLDPPYDFPDLGAAVAQAALLLQAGGILVLEHSRRRQPPDAVAPLTQFRVVRAGDSQLAFYTLPPQVRSAAAD